MIFERLKTANSKKKLLGAIIIMAFVAVFSLMATRYIVISDVSLTTVAIVAVLVIVSLLLFIGVRRRKRSKGK